MKEETTYLWRIKWAGRWATTRHHCTEIQIKREHSEAICLRETKRVELIPENDEELRAISKTNATSAFMSRTTTYVFETNTALQVVHPTSLPLSFSLRERFSWVPVICRNIPKTGPVMLLGLPMMHHLLAELGPATSSSS